MNHFILTPCSDTSGFCTAIFRCIIPLWDIVITAVNLENNRGVHPDMDFTAKMTAFFTLWRTWCEHLCYWSESSVLVDFIFYGEWCHWSGRSPQVVPTCGNRGVKHSPLFLVTRGRRRFFFSPGVRVSERKEQAVNSERTCLGYSFTFVCLVTNKVS